MENLWVIIVVNYYSRETRRTWYSKSSKNESSAAKVQQIYNMRLLLAKLETQSSKNHKV